MKAALQQIEEKRYEAALVVRGVEKGNIQKYGFAFSGKNVLIGKAGPRNLSGTGGNP